MLPIARGLAAYFAYMLAASLLALPLSPGTLLAAKIAPPWAIALVATCAAVVAAVIDYYAFRRVFTLGALARVRGHRLFKRAEALSKVAPFWTTSLFAGLPLPFWIVRILMPLSGYPLPRYAAAVALGRFCRIVVIAWFGTVVDIPTPILVALLIAGVVVAAVGAAARRFRASRAHRSAAAEPPSGSEPPATS